MKRFLIHSKLTFAVLKTIIVSYSQMSLCMADWMTFSASFSQTNIFFDRMGWKHNELTAGSLRTVEATEGGGMGGECEMR